MWPTPAAIPSGEPPTAVSDRLGPAGQAASGQEASPAAAILVGLERLAAEQTSSIASGGLGGRRDDCEESAGVQVPIEKAALSPSSWHWNAMRHWVPRQSQTISSCMLTEHSPAPANMYL